MNENVKKENILKYLNGDYDVTVLTETASTNDDAKVAARCGATEGTVIVAESQTAGRGRLEKRFFSPKDTGIYFSMIFAPEKTYKGKAYMTVFAANAVAETAEKLCGVRAEIKWVNDVYVGGGKCAGILTEFADDKIIVGIGVNIENPTNGFPADIAGKASALISTGGKDIRAEFVGETVSRLFEKYRKGDIPGEVALYKSKSNVTGRLVEVTDANEKYLARVVGIDDECHLILDRGKGTYTLTYGDVQFSDENN